MENQEFAQWLLEMIEKSKQLPDEYFQDWKNNAREMSTPEKLDNVEKWVDIIWKLRNFNDEELLKLEGALEKMIASPRAE